MKQLICLSAVLFLFAACGKDSFETKPQIKIKSVNTTEVASGQMLSVTLEFTDKEGDVSDSLVIVRQRLNINGPVTPNPSPYKIPNFPKTIRGEIQVNFDYNNDLTFNISPPIHIPGSIPRRNEKDTMRLKFVVKDKAGNWSDTATLDNIFVERL